MTEKVWQVAMIGTNSVSQYLHECLGQSPRIRLIPIPGEQSTEGVDALIFVDIESAESVMAGIQRGHDIFLHQPYRLKSQELNQLTNQASSAKRQISTLGLRRESLDFQTALAAVESNRLGTLRSIRFFSCEIGLPIVQSDGSALRQFGLSIFDQLLVLARSVPQRVYGHCLNNMPDGIETGFLATIDFENGCTAQIELQTQSRLSYRTGWMLEGNHGSFREDKLLTTTADGEIIDERVATPKRSADWLANQLIHVLERTPSQFPTLSETARVVQLIELIETSSESGKALLFSKSPPA